MTEAASKATLALRAADRPDVHVADDIAATAGALIAAEIVRVIGANGRCRLGLSGGSTPGPTYAWLRAHLPPACYAQLHVTWVDERHLPVAAGALPGDWRAFDVESNLRLAYETWLAHVPLAPEQVLPLCLGAAVEADVLRFGRTFLRQFDGALDIAVLGSGPDGHIASLFAGHPGLEVDDVCFAIHDSPKPPPVRVSLAMPVLQRAGRCYVVATGAAKAEVLGRAYLGDLALPVARLRAPGRHLWLLDRAAAGAILAAWR